MRLFSLTFEPNVKKQAALFKMPAVSIVLPQDCYPSISNKFARPNAQ